MHECMRRELHGGDNTWCNVDVYGERTRGRDQLIVRADVKKELQIATRIQLLLYCSFPSAGFIVAVDEQAR